MTSSESRPAAIVVRVAGSILLALGVGVVFAPSASAETTIAVTAGAAGTYQPGGHVPVLVTVKADRLVQGVVRVSVGSGVDMRMMRPGAGDSTAKAEVPIEVSGGSAKQVALVVPTPPVFNNGQANASFNGAVELREGDAIVAQGDFSVSTAAWAETVGVLPKLASLGALPDDVPLRFSGGKAKLVPIETSVLEAGAAALEPYPAIVAHPADLAELSPAARAAVVGWVGSGGTLLVDGIDGPVTGLPDEWQPRDGVAIAGEGEVRLTGGAAQAGRWTDILLPTQAGAGSAVQAANANGIGGFGFDGTSIAQALGKDAGFHLPELGVLIGFLVAYVILAGPVTFIVLARMKRRTLAWFVVPALAMLFTGGFVVGGLRLRENLETAHATVIDLAPGGARAYSTVLVGSINGGRTEVDMPGQWWPEAALGQMWSSSNAAATPIAPVVSHGDRSSASLDIAAGEMYLVRSSGPVAGYDDAVEVEAQVDGTKITGTITNNLDVALDEVRVLVGGAMASAGRIEGRATASFTVSDASSQALGGNAMPELSSWPMSTNQGPMWGGGMTTAVCAGPGCDMSFDSNMNGPRFDENTPVNTQLWSEWAPQHRDALRSQTSVAVVGWTKGLAAPVTADGDRPITRGRTAIVAHGTIRASRLDTAGVYMELLRGADFDNKGGEPTAIDQVVVGTTYRFRLPASVDGKPLDPTSIVVRAPIDLHQVAIYTKQGWKVTPKVEDRGVAFRLSADDIVDGSILVKVHATDEVRQRPITAGGSYLGWRFVTEDAQPDEVTTTLVPGTEPVTSAATATGAGS